MDNTTESDAMDVARWNRELANGLIQNTVILSLYLVFGIVGNTLVIAVYTFRMKKKSEDRYFVPFLAVSDLCACIVCASMAIALNQLQVEFTNNALCKGLWFFATMTTLMSIFLLTIIAIHRYLKVCRPFGRQLNLKLKRIVVGVAVALAILLGFPTAILYGSVEFNSPGGKLTGRRCSKLKDVNKAGSLVYSALVGLIAITAIVTLIFTYCKIGRTIYVHFQNMAKAGIIKKKVLNTKTSESSSNVKKATDTETKSEIISSQIETVSEPLGKSETIANDKDNAVWSSTKKCIDQPVTSNDNQTFMYKFSLMFLIITVVFLICYVPKLILIVIEGLNSKFWENLSKNVRPFILFLYRIYILNNVTNPLIYALLDIKFREETKSLMQCFLKRDKRYHVRPI